VANRNVIGNLYRLLAVCVLLSLPITIAACSENTTPPQLEAFIYPKGNVQCPAGTRSGLVGATDGKVSVEGIKYMVRTPSNYEATFAHPLLMVYAGWNESLGVGTAH
jgi:polyhydroxybutyrate depolymerase